MNEEFNLYEDEFQKYSKALMSKFHQAPTATQQDYREAMEEIQQFEKIIGWNVIVHWQSQWSPIHQTHIVQE
ncbi:unnamed protein product (macronuclear) [Paramecium tetraurelia]|uniref:Uncharacterized protein n=1 Tax=Paramecium tetraurelia TaxID=5888 RepID=A0DJC3_PARTE|nr:uncharacterized protein GSPATT00017484001 [Paramecium tetraurelia]CAK83140.1 unnamed protein product [Paramecium tetraurelia]|eukprot:XP_001450537.1 hypothetical protein (macronuclear) [Paramecium tetraurelia strain d4-2]